MRPVNLIPPEERRGERAPARRGALSYLLLAGLGVLLIAVVALGLVSRDISAKEAEVAALETREAEVSARAESLASFANFQLLKDARVATVTALAQSRFDWERVIRELSLVIPKRVWLVSLIGTVSPDVSVEGGEGVGLRSTVAGPALELVGCARSHRDVARLISSLGDIDGVTRVTAEKSEKGGGSAGGGGGDSDCRTRDFVTRFEVVAAFDAIPVPEGAVPPPASPGESDAGDGGVTAAQEQSTAEGQEVAQAESSTEQAANAISAGGGESR